MEKCDISASSNVVGKTYAAYFFETVCREVSAAERVLRQLYPDGAKCASCGSVISGKRALETFWRGERTYCSRCNSKFMPVTGTILAGAHLTFAQFEVICVLLSLGVDHQRIAAMADCHIDTIAAWHAKIRYWEAHV